MVLRAESCEEGRVPGHPTVDIVVPVHNEVSVVGESVRRLHDYLQDFPFPWVITVVDNASTDGTWEVASALADEHPEIRAMQLEEKGRGRALRAAWSASDADVVAYMDVDLSTGLDALLPLIAPLVSGHSDVSIGSRLAPGAAVARGPKREAISRTYNLMLRTLFATQIRDMQCGFKALRKPVAVALLAAVADDEWFFDTELLLLAERNGLRIHQLPVDWIDDPDSRVHVTRTARQDVRGALRLARTFVRGGGRIELSPTRSRLADDFGRRLVSFGAIGVMSTLFTVAIFLLGRDALGSVGANAVALSATFVANTWLNARFSYQSSRPGWGAVSLIFVLTLAASTAVLALVDAADGGPVVEVLALLAVWVVAGVARLAHLNRYVRGAQRSRW
jgi:glycosyltransferase involved in cell wall biosynthesis